MIPHSIGWTDDLVSLVAGLLFQWSTIFSISARSPKNSRCLHYNPMMLFNTTLLSFASSSTGSASKLLETHNLEPYPSHVRRVITPFEPQKSPEFLSFITNWFHFYAKELILKKLTALTLLRVQRVKYSWVVFHGNHAKDYRNMESQFR